MNLEAISGIKRASQACAALRKECLKLIVVGADTAQINLEATKISSQLKALSNFNDKRLLTFGINDEFPDESNLDSILQPGDLVKISISLNIEGWTAQCSASKYLGDEAHITELENENRTALIETSRSLCPGFQLDDLEEVFSLYHENSQFEKCHECYSQLHPELPIKQRLKAGDLLSLTCNSSCLNDKTWQATHQETVLITANGCEILTIDDLFVS